MDSFLSPDNATALAIYFQTHPVPQRFNAGIVVASVIVSVLGSYTTLLLLGRRTANAGFRNWLWLVLAATTMASVGIWSMHFLGMNMALAASPDVTWYIQFSPGFTVLSLFVPLVALVLAFVFVGAEIEPDAADCNSPANSSLASAIIFDKSSFRLIVGGILFGGTVALMHYCAAFSASFRPSYRPLETCCAVVLACFASTVALLIFFRLQSRWKDNWWKRLLCAAILATAVCGMHYLGLAGTHWYVPLGKTSGFTLGKRNLTIITIAISVMCFALCIISFILLLSDYFMRQVSRRNARRVVVASATFDKHGRLLVKPDGMLPIRVVETSLPLNDILTELDYRQPIFQWLFTLSWDWSMLQPFLPRILSNSLKEAQGTANNGIFARQKPKEKSSYSSSKSAAQIFGFRDQCIEAACCLAQELNLPIDQMGVLFDSALRTGTRVVAQPTPGKQRRRAGSQSEKETVSGDEESVWSISAPPPGHEGVMLFLVREVSGRGADNADSYTRRGYRFADTRYFSPVLADRVAVPRSDIDGLVDQLKLYARRGTKPCVRPGGVYVGFFGVRPSISRQGGLDTLVYSFCHHQIPAYRLPDVDTITPEIRDWVVSVSGATLQQVSNCCEQEAVDPEMNGLSEQMSLFQSGLFLGIDAMLNSLKVFSGIENNARLASEILEVPSSLDDSTPPANIIIFECVLPAPLRHGLEEPGAPRECGGSFAKPNDKDISTFVFVPYSLFAKSQMMMLRGTGSKKFQREVRTEMMKSFPVPAESLHQMWAPNDGTLLKYTDMNRNFAHDPVNDDGLDDDDSSHSEIKDARERVSVVTMSGVLSNEGHEYTRPPAVVGLSPRIPKSLVGKTAVPLSSSLRYDTRDSDGASSIIVTPENGSPPKAMRYSPPPLPANSHPLAGNGWQQEAAPAYSPTRPPQAVLGSPMRSAASIRNQRFIDSSVRSQAKVTTSNDANRSYGSITGLNNLGPERSASTARLRAEDWHARLLDSLEHSAAGEELLGVEW